MTGPTAEEAFNARPLDRAELLIRQTVLSQQTSIHRTYVRKLIHFVRRSITPQPAHECLLSNRRASSDSRLSRTDAFDVDPYSHPLSRSSGVPVTDNHDNNNNKRGDTIF